MSDKYLDFIGEASQVNWADSPEVKRNRQLERQLTAEESAALIAEAGGRW